MEAVETIRQYYLNTRKETPTGFDLHKANTSHFNILESESCLNTFPFMRRDYYKICLVDNALTYQYDGQKIEIEGPCIVFSNPNIPYGMERKYLCNKRKGYICLFNEGYLTGEIKAALIKLNALYARDIFPYIMLTNEEYELFSLYFKNLYDEYRGNFEFRKEIITNLLRVVIYLAIKTQMNHYPEIHFTEQKDRLVTGFIKLLDRQFPVDSPNSILELKTPADFADNLNVHVNHLNHALKTNTGKSTSQLIQERVLTESLALIQYSDWSISEVGQSLGFEYPAHFSQFIKKHTGFSPKYFKKSS